MPEYDTCNSPYTSEKSTVNRLHSFLHDNLLGHFNSGVFMATKNVFFFFAFITICYIYLKYFDVKDITITDFKDLHVKKKSTKLRTLPGENSPDIPVPQYETFFKSAQFNVKQQDLALIQHSAPPERTKIIHKIQYGTFLKPPRRTPVVMMRLHVAEDLVQKFQELPMFSCPEPELEGFGLKNAVDYPRSKEHIYHEGYFHTELSRDPIFSRNPRSGVDFMKSPADDFLRSFYEAMRRINKPIFDHISRRLWESAALRSPGDPAQDICGTLSNWISSGVHFADLSVQIHYGTAIGDDQLFWHADAENSLLHLGITVRGYRVLHSKRANLPEEVAQELLEDQRPGDAYLSTSALINHAPSYPEVDWDNRIVALQARILYTTEQLKSFRQRRTEESWLSLTEILTAELSTADISIPTLQQVLEVAG